MKFLCIKVKKDWLTVDHQINKVKNLGLEIYNSYIGIVIETNNPSAKELTIVDNAVNNLFGNHKKAFPLKVIDINDSESTSVIK